MDLVAIAKEFGLPVVAIVALAWALSRYHAKATKDLAGVNKALNDALNTRINVLECELSKQNKRIIDLEEARYEAAREFSSVMRDISVKVVNAMHESSQASKEVARAMNRLTDTVVARPCQIDDKNQTRRPTPAHHLETEAIERKTA